MLSKLASLLPGKAETKPIRVIEGHSLYYFDGCGFCFRVFIAMKRLGIELEKRNIMHSMQYREELLQGGGRTTVPCLRIERGDEVEWMYESADIIRYLENLVAEHD